MVLILCGDSQACCQAKWGQKHASLRLMRSQAQPSLSGRCSLLLVQKSLRQDGLVSGLTPWPSHQSEMWTSPFEMGRVVVKQAPAHIKRLTHEGDGSFGAWAGALCNLTPAIAADSLAGEVTNSVMPCAKRETAITPDQRNTWLSHTFAEQQAHNWTACDTPETLSPLFHSEHKPLQAYSWLAATWPYLLHHVWLSELLKLMLSFHPCQKKPRTTVNHQW